MKTTKEKLIDDILSVAFTNADKTIIIRAKMKDSTMRSYASDYFIRKVNEVLDKIERLKVEIVSDVVVGEWTIDSSKEYIL